MSAADDAMSEAVSRADDAMSEAVSRADDARSLTACPVPEVVEPAVW